MSLNCLKEKVFTKLSSAGLNGLMLWGADNFTYLTQIPLPFAQSYPHKKSVFLCANEKSVLICTADFAQLVRSLDNEIEVLVIPESLNDTAVSAKVIETAKSFGGGIRWGVDASRISEACWKNLSAALDLSDCDKLLSDCRMVKEAFEIANLTRASRMAELGVVSTLNHTEGTFDSVSYSRAESAERMRVHVAEFGGQAAGNLTALQGDDLMDYTGINHGRISTDGFTRYDLTAAAKGYWGAAGRTIYVGKPGCEAKKAYEDNLKLKAVVVDQLRPGAKCSDIFAKTLEKSTEWNIPCISEAGFGYGLGVSEREAPFLNASDDTVLCENMVIAVDVWTYGPKGEWIHSIDTYAVTKDGSEKISWYRDYDRLYEMIGITARHG